MGKNLKEIFEDSKYLELNKTYRSSPEIIEHTNKILGLTHVSAIRRDNNRPVIFREEKSNLTNASSRTSHANAIEITFKLSI